MDKEKFLNEIKDNTLGELQLIYDTQEELYSKDERKIIAEKIKELKKKFYNDIKNMSLEELKQMKVSTDQLRQTEASTDQLYYIDKEVKDTIIDKRIKELEAEKVKKLLPKEIICPKCSAPNPFKNDQCMYCCYDLDKTKYYDLEYYESKETYNSKQNEEQEDSYAFQYVISFLIPLVGFIIGGMLLSSESKERVSVGKKCILLGVIAMVIASIGIAIIVNSNMNSNTILNNITRIR